MARAMTEQQKRRRWLTRLAKKYGCECIASNEGLAQLPDDLWPWVEEKMSQFVQLHEALRSLN